VQHSRGKIPTIPTIREIITKDCLSIRQKSTIIDAMPEEYKQKEKVKYGKEGGRSSLNKPDLDRAQNLLIRAKAVIFCETFSARKSLRWPSRECF
jgi:hypothetical protein